MKNDWEIIGIDHFAILVKSLDAWLPVYTSLMRGKVFSTIRDANPNGASSMNLCGITMGGGRVSVALVEGIDRTEKSQVTKFVEQHGDHAVQHVAIAVRNIEALVAHMRANGVHFLGEILAREDAFGPLKQIFTKRFDAKLGPAEGPFFEFVERPQQSGAAKAADSFDAGFAQQLYKDVEEAQTEGDKETFFAFDTLPHIPAQEKQ